MPANSMRAAGSWRNPPTVPAQRPHFLRAGVQAVLAREQHDRLHVHADVGPLRRPEAAVDIEEQPDRRAEAIEIACELQQPRRLVLARNVDSRVQVLPGLEAARAIGLAQAGRIDVVLVRAVAARVGGDLHAHPCLQLGERLTGERIHAPRLQVAAGRRVPRGVEDGSRTVAPGTGVCRKARQLLRLATASLRFTGVPPGRQAILPEAGGDGLTVSRRRLFFATLRAR